MNDKNILNRLASVGIRHAEDEPSMQLTLLTNYIIIFLALISSIGMALSAINSYIVATITYFTLLMVQILSLVLQKKGRGLISRILLSFLPLFLIIIPPFLTKSHLQESGVEYYYAILGSSVLPIILFSPTKDKKWLYASIVYHLLGILSYDTLFGLDTRPGEVFEGLSQAYLFLKMKQLMLYFVILGGFLAKTTLNHYFEQKLNEYNKILGAKHSNMKNAMEDVQALNEELHSLTEEMLRQNEELNKKQYEILQINRRIDNYTQMLMDLAKSKSLRKGDWRQASQEICKLVSDALNVNRVGIWELDRRRNLLLCINLFDANQNLHSSGMELQEKDYQAYFEALYREEIIIAPDAVSHPDTAVFENTYLQPFNIKSMLDTPYFINATLAGVICLEATDEIRNWTNDEISFCKSIADMVALATESAERKRAEDRIRLQKEEILAKNQELQQQQQEIKAINENLELKVKERTQSLEKRNSQLQEYTYVNSHLLRGPLCRILGIIYLLEHNMIDESEIDFLQHLKESASELDDMVKKITHTLEIDQSAMEVISNDNMLN